MPRKSTTPPPSDEEILKHDNVPPYLASKYIGWSTPTMYRALQEGRAPFGFGVECAGGKWSYNISPGLLVRYKHGDFPIYRLKEVEEIAVDGIKRILDERLAAIKAGVAAL